MNIRVALADAGIPAPSEELLDAMYRTRTDGWYVQTHQGWFWWDGRSREWRKQPTSPRCT